MRVRKINQVDVKLHDSTKVKLKTAGNTSVVQFTAGNNKTCTVRNLTKDTYIDIRTGEVKVKKKSESRYQSPKSVRKSINRLMDLIRCNATDPAKCKWLTVTYQDVMTDGKQAFLDTKLFLRKLKRYLAKQIDLISGQKSFQYITIAEPQGERHGNSWHLHILLIFNDTAPFIANDTISELWSHGITSTHKVFDGDGLALYFKVYLSDIEYEDDNSDNEEDADKPATVEKIVNGVKKQFLKGDLSAVTNTTMTYTADNRLDTFNGQKVTYDADGNMTYGPLNGVMTAFTYDCRNRLIKAGDTTYEYDAENTRIAIQTKEKREEYVVDKNTTYSQVLSITTYEKNLLGQFTKEKDYTVYTYGIGLISQERTAKGDGNEETTGSGEYYLYHYNQIGSTTQITDMEGKVVYTYTYSAYGERIGTYDADGNIIDDNSNPIRFLYNGQAGVETDENGLYYMRARYYNTDIKRFINRDIVDGTIQNSQSLNKYSYVQGNPISLTDPFGLCPEGGGILDYLKQNGHTILDALGFVPGIGVIADLANAIWYYREGNTQMAMISAIAVLPLAGDIAAGILKGAAYATKSCKVLKASMVVKNTCRLVGATAQTGVNISNAQSAAYTLYEEYEKTGRVSWQNVGLFVMSSVATVSGVKSTIGNAKSLKAVGTQKITPVGEWGCFVAGTPVKTEDGQKNIEEIKAGERVYAKNTETGEEGYKEVVRVFVKDVNKLVHLQIGETKIDTTTNHPFWVVGYGFKEAGDLGAGEKVLTATGEIKTITSVEVEELETPVTVYNFEVKDWHTYYVSELEVLVHNMCKVAGKTKAAGESGSSSNPTFKVSRKQYPNHAKMLENAQNEGHSLTNLTRGSGTRAAKKNRYESQKAIRKQQGGPPKGFDYDEFPYASTKQGGAGAHVEPVPSAENQAVGRDLGQFYRKYNIHEDDLFDVEIIE